MLKHEGMEGCGDMGTKGFDEGGMGVMGVGMKVWRYRGVREGMERRRAKTTCVSRGENGGGKVAHRR